MVGLPVCECVHIDRPQCSGAAGYFACAARRSRCSPTVCALTLRQPLALHRARIGCCIDAADAGLSAHTPSVHAPQIRVSAARSNGQRPALVGLLHRPRKAT